MLSNSYYFFDHGVIEVARRERDQVVAELGQKFVRAPVEFVRWGFDDFKRYRRSASK